MIMRWQVQEAEQRVRREVLRRAQADGPQIITRHGEEVAVIIEATEFHKLASGTADFKDYLQTGPSFDDVDPAGPSTGRGTSTGRPRSR